MPHYTRGMGSRAYWEERMLDRDLFARQTEDEVLRIINSKYQAAFREIRRDLNDFYNRYATENGLTLQQLQQRLSPIEMREYQTQMRELQRMYSQYQSERILQEMQILSNRAYITRQMALLDSINIKLIETAHNVQITMQDHLEGIYRREYAAALEGLGVNSNVVIPTRAVREIIEYPYAGAMFSDRIWRNKDQLLNYINDDLVKGIIKGSSIQNMSKDLMNRCNTLYYQAERLVRTETNYAMTQGHLNGYKDAGIEQYQFFAFIDNRTSRQCKTLDNMVYNIREAQAGTNLPPMHPNCRSTIIPIVNRKAPIDIIEKEPAKTDAAAPEIKHLEFKDKKSATEYAIKNLGFEKVNWGRKLTQEMINDTISSIDRVFNMYPQLKGSMKEITTASDMGRAIASVSYYGTLKLSTSLYYNQNKAKRIHTITHECSHMIERIKDWNKFAPKVVDEAINNLGYDAKEAASAVRAISRYATTGKDECMAEAFAEALTEGDKATPLAKEILKILNKELK